jgi:hypothetical protein
MSHTQVLFGSPSKDSDEDELPSLVDIDALENGE